MDMDQLSRIQPNDGGTGFVFSTFADTAYREDAPGAERDRLDAMQRFATANRLCHKGYDVTRRQVVARPPTAIGVDTRRDIHYHSTCR
jgi:hypothetical protein